MAPALGARSPSSGTRRPARGAHLEIFEDAAHLVTYSHAGRVDSLLLTHLT